MAEGERASQGYQTMQAAGYDGADTGNSNRVKDTLHKPSPDKLPCVEKVIVERIMPPPNALPRVRRQRLLGAGERVVVNEVRKNCSGSIPASI